MYRLELSAVSKQYPAGRNGVGAVKRRNPPQREVVVRCREADGDGFVQECHRALQSAPLSA